MHDAAIMRVMCLRSCLPQDVDVDFIVDESGKPRMLGSGAFGQVLTPVLPHL